MKRQQVSMKKIYIGALAFGLIAMIVVLYAQVIKPKLDSRTISVTAPVTINNDTLGLSFTYPSGEEGYTMIEPPLPDNLSSGLKKVYIIMGTEEYIKYEQNDTETPPSISVFILEAPKEGAVGASRLDRLTEWAKSNSQFSSYNTMVGESEEIEMDGASGIHYQAEGLYRQSVYLVYYQGLNYVFVGQYEREDDSIYGTFTDLINSVLYN